MGTIDGGYSEVACALRLNSRNTTDELVDGDRRTREHVAFADRSRRFLSSPWAFLGLAKDTCETRRRMDMAESFRKDT